VLLEADKGATPASAFFKYENIFSQSAGKALENSSEINLRFFLYGGQAPCSVPSIMQMQV